MLGFELLLWFLVILFLFLVFLQGLGFHTKQIRQDWQQQELQRNAIMMMDSLLKNRNEEKPQYGAAVFWTSKKRVQSNQLDQELLNRIQSVQEEDAEPVFFQSIKLRFSDGHEETVFENPMQENCLGVERMAVIQNQKTILFGVVCRA